MDELETDTSETQESGTMKCPHCGTESITFDDLQERCHAMPNFGELMFCFSCGNLSSFVKQDGAGMLVKATEQEEAEHGQDELYVQARRMLTFTSDPVLAASLTALSANPSKLDA